MVALWRSWVCFRQDARWSKLCAGAYPRDGASGGEHDDMLPDFGGPAILRPANLLPMELTRNMTKTAKARFAIKTWDEKPLGEGQDLPKLTRASVAKIFTGDIEGEGQVEYLMMYRGDGSATFVGLERVVGRIGSKAGSFVLQRTGTFENGQAKESYSVIPGSATGDLLGLRGDGSSAVGHGMEHPFELNYEFV